MPKLPDPFTTKPSKEQTDKTKVLLDQIFKQSDVKYSLNIFSEDSIEKLALYKKSDGNIYLQCFATEKEKRAKPEEIIRQLFLLFLNQKLNYSRNQMLVEVPIKMGSTYASKKADIVVYKEKAKINPHIILEVKKPNRKDGLEQLHSYMNATGVYYGLWSNGQEQIVQWRVEPNIFEELNRLPAINETIDGVKEPLQKKQLEPIVNLKETVEYLEDEALANAGVNTFEEIFKLIFAKLYDEFTKRNTDDYMEFRTTTGTPEEQYKRIGQLFEKAKDEWADIFDPQEKINLSPEALIVVVSAMQKYKFFEGDLDVLDAAFEYLVNPEQKGDKGQYFTPRHIVDMMVKMLNPKANENMLDPACGPCGFPIHTFKWVVRNEFKTADALRRRDYAQRRLFGIDFDPRLVKVAKAMMLIVGDGKTNVYRANSLDPRGWVGTPVSHAVQLGIFDVLMTNPPFSGKIKTPEVLGTYDLAFKGDSSKNRRVNQLGRDILFIERCLQFLKSGGRMAIVLPQGDLNNTSSQFVREWIVKKARILAVVGLGANTFKPFTGTKTSVLFLQKWHEDEKPLEDYPIFMAVSERSGKDTSGDYIYKEIDGKRVVDHDLNEIADEFIKFAKGQKFNFWKD